MSKKKHLIEQVAEDQGITPAQASRNIDAVLNAVSLITFRDGSLTLRGFGKFEARKRARKVITTRINIASTGVVVSPAKLALCFSASSFQKLLAK